MINGLDLFSMLNGLDLFAGIGGMSIALKNWVRPIAYCEIDPYCQGVLLSRMVCGLLPEAPIWDDVQSLCVQSPDNSIDILYGGFPCQDISIAGHGKGLAGERSGLYWEIHRLAKEIKPKFIFLENVAAIRSRGGIEVLRSIAELGYNTRFCIISAASVGACHRRERWFLLAHANDNGCSSSPISRSAAKSIQDTSQGKKSSGKSERMDSSQDVANTQSHRKVESCGRQKKQSSSSSPCIQDYWKETQPPVCGVDDGIPCWVDRIKSLGNAVVLEQAKKAFEILMGIRNVA